MRVEVDLVKICEEFTETVASYSRWIQFKTLITLRLMDLLIRICPTVKDSMVLYGLSQYYHKFESVAHNEKTET